MCEVYFVTDTTLVRARITIDRIRLRPMIDKIGRAAKVVREWTFSSWDAAESLARERLRGRELAP